MRATLTFTSDSEEVLSDAAYILNKRIESYGESDTHKTAEKIANRVEHATVEQLPKILGDIAALRTQLAKLDFALEDTMKIVSGYYQAMTVPPEETQTNDEV